MIDGHKVEFKYPFTEIEDKLNADNESEVRSVTVARDLLRESCPGICGSTISLDRKNESVEVDELTGKSRWVGSVVMGCEARVGDCRVLSTAPEELIAEVFLEPRKSE